VIVVYSPGNPDYRSAYPSPSGRVEDDSVLPRGLFIAVAVLGLASYALSFGPVVNGEGATGWYVRFAALAGLCAAFGLLRNHKPLPLVTAVLAMMGFLDGMSSLLSPDNYAAPLGLPGLAEPGWAFVAIVVLNALQATAAIAAMLLWPKAGAENTAATAGYEAYVEYYNQAVRNYYGQQAQGATPQQTHRGGYGQGSAGAQASAPQTQRAQRAPQYGDYTDFVSQGEPGHSSSAASSAAAQSQTVPPGGLASFRPAQPPAAQQENEADQSAWPSSP
jgi:uncharacterized protein DUF5336